jgi:hypothetical protein
MTDTIYPDVSEFQAPVNDSFSGQFLVIRSNDGTYQDKNFAQNYQWCVAAANAGKITGFAVYAYWRANWSQTAQTMIDMVTSQGGPHPLMAAMIDLESGGNPGGDQSAGVNGMFNQLAQWLGNPARVFGYANSSDFFSMWQTRPAGLRVVGAGYGSNPNLPGQIAHQYTDGNGYDAELPQGITPWSTCDMNSADGLSPQQLAQALGLAPAAPPPNAINDYATANVWLGTRVTADEQVCPDGIGRFVQFANGYVYWTPTTGAHGIPTNIFAKWASLGWEKSVLGYPVLDATTLTQGNCQAFQGGLIYQETGKDAAAVHGAIGNTWQNLGFEKSPMGWPIADEAIYNTTGRAQSFDNGTLYWDPSSVVYVAK